MPIRRRRTRPIVWSSGKFSEPIANTPRSVTVLTQEVLARQGRHQPQGGRAAPRPASPSGPAKAATPSATVFSSAVSTPATTSSSTAFAIRPSISARISSPSRSRFSRDRRRSINGRGTAGGAINIVTKQATTEVELLQRRLEIRQRQHQARHLRRQSGHHSDARHPHGRHVAERQCLRSATLPPTIAGAAWRR